MYNSILFVAGPDRSGTTMLTLMLSSHPAICISPENDVISGLLRQYPPGHILEGYELSAFKSKLAGDAKLAGLKVPMENYLETVRNYEKIDARTIAMDYLIAYRDAAKPEATIIGQKKNFLDFWRPMKAYFPEARLISIFRDCRSTALSAAQNLPGQTVLSATRSWVKRARRADQYRTRWEKDYLELKYEQLVSNPDNLVKQIGLFLGLENAQTMVEFHNQNKKQEQIVAGQEHKHRKTSQPINTNQIDSWRRCMDKNTIRQIEWIAREEMRSRGYELEEVNDISTAIRWQLELQKYMSQLLDGMRQKIRLIVDRMRAIS